MLHATALEIPDGPQLEVDLGCGDARFLLERARSYPDRMFIGLDRDAGALQSAATKAARLELDNLQLAAADLTAELDALFFAGRVHRFHVHFPDGWLAAAGLDPLLQIVEALEAQGEIFVQTESAVLARGIQARLAADPRLWPVEQLEANPFEAQSARELSCEAAGLTVHRLLYTRQDDAEAGDDGWD